MGLYFLVKYVFREKQSSFSGGGKRTKRWDTSSREMLDRVQNYALKMAFHAF